MAVLENLTDEQIEEKLQARLGNTIRQTERRQRNNIREEIINLVTLTTIDYEDLQASNSRYRNDKFKIKVDSFNEEEMGADFCPLMGSTSKPQFDLRVKTARIFPGIIRPTAAIINVYDVTKLNLAKDVKEVMQVSYGDGLPIRIRLNY